MHNEPPPSLASPIKARNSEDVSALQLSSVFFRRIGTLGLTRSFGHIKIQLNLASEIDTYNRMVRLSHSTLVKIKSNQDLWSTAKGRIDLIFLEFEQRLSNQESILRSACLLLSCGKTIVKAKFPRPENVQTIEPDTAEMPVGQYFRNPRQAPFLSGIASMAALGLSLYGEYEIHKIRRHISGLEHRSELITAEMNNTRNVVNDNSKHLDVLKSEFNKLLNLNKHISFIASSSLIIAHLQAMLENLSQHCENMFHILVDRKVNPVIFGGEQIKEALASISTQAARFGLEPATESVASLVNFKLSYVIASGGEGLVDILIHVPLISKTRLHLYQYLNVPLIDSTGRGVVLDEDHDILAVNGIRTISTTLSSDDLHQCDRHESAWLCPVTTTQSKLPSSCLGSLYDASSEGVAALCNFRTKKISNELMIEIGNRQVLVRAPPTLSLSVQQDCSNAPEEKDRHFIIRHERVLTVPKGCSLIGPSTTYQGGPGTLIYHSIKWASISLEVINKGANFEMGTKGEFGNGSYQNELKELEWNQQFLPPVEIGPSNAEGDALVTIVITACVLLIGLASCALLLALYLRRRRRGPRRSIMGRKGEIRAPQRRWPTWFSFPRREEKEAQQQQQPSPTRLFLRRATNVDGGADDEIIAVDDDILPLPDER